MSYDIMKRIRVADNKVYLTCASNNVYPRYYEEWECKSLTKILQEEGQEALDIEILRQYEQGNFQRGSNKYVRALKVLRHFPEYKAFDWRRGGLGDEYTKTQETRAQKENEFKSLLARALKTKLPRDKFIIYQYNYEGKCYLNKITKRCAKFSFDIKKAKVFRYFEEANGLKPCFHNGEHWQIEKVK